MPYSSDYPLLEGYYSSADNVFQYRLPKGWLDASGGEETTHHALWLVRSDYGSTITIDEITLDEDSRNVLQQKGVESLANLVLALHERAGLRGVAAPEKLRIGNVDCIVFEQEDVATREISRIVAFVSRGRLYEVSALASYNEKAEIFAIQQRVLETLRW